MTFRMLLVYKIHYMHCKSATMKPMILRNEFMLMKEKLKC